MHTRNPHVSTRTILVLHQPHIQQRGASFREPTFSILKFLRHASGFFFSLLELWKVPISVLQGYDREIPATIMHGLCVKFGIWGLRLGDGFRALDDSGSSFKWLRIRELRASQKISPVPLPIGKS